MGNLNGMSRVLAIRLDGTRFNDIFEDVRGGNRIRKRAGGDDPIGEVTEYVALYLNPTTNQVDPTERRHTDFSTSRADDIMSLNLEKSATHFLGAKIPFSDTTPTFSISILPHSVFFSPLLPPTLRVHALEYRLLL